MTPVVVEQCHDSSQMQPRMDLAMMSTAAAAWRRNVWQQPAGKNLDCALVLQWIPLDSSCVVVMTLFQGCSCDALETTFHFAHQHWDSAKWIVMQKPQRTEFFLVETLCPMLSPLPSEMHLVILQPHQTSNCASDQSARPVPTDTRIYGVVQEHLSAMIRNSCWHLLGLSKQDDRNAALR